jgi:two-component system phosphate regulon response regulator PhoB
MEVALRHRADERPTGPPAEERERRVGELLIDDGRCRVQLGDRPIELTPTEFRLLSKLSDRPGEVVSREALAQAVWGYSDYGVGRSLDVHMRRLRSKLKGGPKLGPTIVTARGFGYRIEPEPTAPTRRAG